MLNSRGVVVILDQSGCPAKVSLVGNGFHKQISKSLCFPVNVIEQDARCEG